MSLEAIKQVTETEENIQTHKAAAEAEARQIVADAEKAGQALVKQMRSKAAEQGKKLLRQAEERAAIRAKEIEAGAEAESVRQRHDTVYNNWYKSVYLPAATPALEQQSAKSTKSVS